MFLFILVVACTKTSLSSLTDAPRNFNDVFEAYWNNMNINYVYWDIDKTNWDSIYLKYKSVFKKLDINNQNDIKESVSYFDQISRTLIDNHYYITFSNQAIINSSLFPAYKRKKQLSNFHDPFPFWHVDTNYLDKNYHLGMDINNFYNGQPLTVLCGTIKNKILYFSCSYFGLSKSYYSNKPNQITPILNYFFNTLCTDTSNIKGVIVDVRSNLGGDLTDLNFFVGRFIESPLVFGYTKYKSGNGRLDYTPWIKSIITPQKSSKKIAVPIVILADNVSASLSETVVMSLKLLPNSSVVGERTFGATGPITNYTTYNSGSFDIPMFMHIQTSSAQFKYINDSIYESIGFPPDILVPFDLNPLLNNSDPQLEKAINILF